MDPGSQVPGFRNKTSPAHLTRRRCTPACLDTRHRGHRTPEARETHAQRRANNAPLIMPSGRISVTGAQMGMCSVLPVSKVRVPREIVHPDIFVKIVKITL